MAGTPASSVTGPQGSPGPQGATGATGATGPQGDPGEGVPTGGTTGQVLAKASNANFDTEWATGGGSQPLGVTVNAADVATGGPQTITALGAGEIVTVGFSAITVTDQDVAVVLGNLADMVAAESGDPQDVEDAALCYFDTDLFVGQTFLPIGHQQVTVTTPRVLASGPLVAAWLTSGTGSVVDAAPGAWQATHAFALGDWIIDSADHLQKVTSAGTTAGSEPTWPEASGTTTTDGSVEWTDEGAVPTVGSADVVATLATPS